MLHFINGVFKLFAKLPALGLLWPFNMYFFYNWWVIFYDKWATYFCACIFLHVLDSMFLKPTTDEYYTFWPHLIDIASSTKTLSSHKYYNYLPLSVYVSCNKESHWSLHSLSVLHNINMLYFNFWAHLFDICISLY